MRKRLIRHCAIGLGVAAAAATAAAQTIQYSITRVPTNFFGPELETRGGTSVNGLNDLGQFVGTFGERNATILGLPHAFIHGSNDAGLIVYQGQESRSVPEGYRLGTIFGERYPDPEYRYLDLFPGAGWTNFNARATFPNAINSAGMVVGRISSDHFGTSPNTAFLYDSESRALTLLSVPGAISSEATDINASGQIVGNFKDAQGLDRGFLFSNGAYTVINRPGYEQGGTRIGGLNDLGAIVGSSYDYANGASFIYRDGSFEDFTVDGLYTVAADINNADQIVGWVGVSGQRRGFFREGSQSVILDFSTAEGSTYPKTINNVGLIGGNVDYAGFFATVSLIPEPASWALWLAGLASASLVARHRHRCPCSI